MIRYQNYEVYTQSPAGAVHYRAIRATNAEHAERMVARELPGGWRVIATVYQFKGGKQK